MARTTRELIEGVTEVDAAASVDSYIDLATTLVDQFCVPAGYAESLLTKIETQLAAHFYRVMDDPIVSSNSVEGASESYANKLGDGLASSEFGKTAMLLDFNGGLARWNKQVVTGMPGPYTFSITSLGCDQRRRRRC